LDKCAIHILVAVNKKKRSTGSHSIEKTDSLDSKICATEQGEETMLV
jgi:hypothetical protein